MRPARSMRRSHCRQAHSRRVAESCVFMLPVLLSILVVQAHQAWGPPLAFSTPMALPKRAARRWCAQSRTCSPTRRVRMAGAEEGQSLSDEDWRAFRARLVQTGISTRTQNESKATQPARPEELSPATDAWVHPLVAAEQGCLLVANPEFFRGAQSYFDKSVIAVVEHGALGTIGLITNRLTPYTMGEVAPSLTAFNDCPLFYGGPVGQGIQVLHRVPGVNNSRQVIAGLFWGADLESAALAIDEGRASPSDFLFFYKYSSWSSGQLDAELAKQVWFLAASDSKALFTSTRLRSVAGSATTTTTHVDSWHFFLKAMGGKYEAVSNKIQLENSLRGTGQKSDASNPDDDADSRGGNSPLDTIVQGQSLLNQLNTGFKAGWVRELLAAPTVEEGAVLVATLVDNYGKCVKENVLAELEAIAAEVRECASGYGGVGGACKTTATIEALNQVLFTSRALVGDTNDYYNPQNSLIHKVLQRRRGNPITISIIYIAIARRLGVKISGINSTSHLLVRVEDPIENEYIDCFSGGKRRSREEAVDFLLGLSRSASGDEDSQVARLKMRRILDSSMAEHEVYTRMLRNLAHALRSAREDGREQLVLLAMRALQDEISAREAPE